MIKQSILAGLLFAATALPGVALADDPGYTVDHFAGPDPRGSGIQIEYLTVTSTRPCNLNAPDAQPLGADEQYLVKVETEYPDGSFSEATPYLTLDDTGNWVFEENIYVEDPAQWTLHFTCVRGSIAGDHPFDSYPDLPVVRQLTSSAPPSGSPSGSPVTPSAQPSLAPTPGASSTPVAAIVTPGPPMPTPSNNTDTPGAQPGMSWPGLTLLVVIVVALAAAAIYAVARRRKTGAPPTPEPPAE